MKKLLIVGAGGFGRELLWYAKHSAEHGRTWEIAGFLDDRPDALARFSHESSVRGPLKDHAPGEDELLLLALGDPKSKLAVAQSLRARGAKFLTLVHPSALVGPSVKLGEGCILCPHVCIPTDAVLEDFVTVNSQSTVGHDAFLGEGVTLSGHCDVTGGARVERGAFLGSGARILPSAVVGEFARVGAGSVVVRRAAARSTVFGVPAKVLSTE